MKSGYKEKYEQFVSAVSRLEEAIDACEAGTEAQVDIMRDAVIKRFEICVELAWKTLREYQIDQGIPPLNNPKAVLKQAYADEMISGDIIWNRMVGDRNLTSHTYDEKTAADIYSRIKDDYFTLFRTLVQQLA